MIVASVIGATGYTGAVLTDILAMHPEVQLGFLTSASFAGKSVAEVFPHLRVDREYVGYSLEALSDSDVAFVCYPHAQAHVAVAELVDSGCRVVDLSADFRLKDPAAYPAWYGFDHPRPDLVEEAVFGLPEHYRSSISQARLVANPGCFPTGMLLGTLPVAERIDDRGVIVDSKSGVSGAGREPTPKTHFCAVFDNFKSYSEVGHRHTPEMVQEMTLAAGTTLPVSFTPHLLPVDRGILSSIYFWPEGGVGTQDEWLSLYAERYRGEPFVEVCETVPSLQDVQGTNYCRVSIRVDPAAGVVKVFTAIDNLVKGASGQAVQNMNIMFGLDEQAGLGRKV